MLGCGKLALGFGIWYFAFLAFWHLAFGILAFVISNLAFSI